MAAIAHDRGRAAVLDRGSVARLASPIPDFSGARTDETLVRLWLRGRAPSTRRKYLEDLAKFEDFSGDKPLAEVTLADLHEFADFISMLMAVSTQARTLAALKSLFSFAQKVGYLPFNVGAALELPKIKDTLAERILTEREVHKLINAPRNHRDRVLLLTIYAGGFRREEVCGLKWRDAKMRDDLGPGMGQLTVFGKGGKTGATPLPGPVYTEVLALKSVAERSPGGQKIKRVAGEDEPIFRSRKKNTARKGHLEVSQVNRIVSQAAKDAGIAAPVSPHWLRHAHATHADARGAPLQLIRDTLKHSNIATTGRYLHSRPSDASSLHLGL